jgi:hypothetical protein
MRYADKPRALAGIFAELERALHADEGRRGAVVAAEGVDGLERREAGDVQPTLGEGQLTRLAPGLTRVLPARRLGGRQGATNGAGQGQREGVEVKLHDGPPRA